MTLVDGFAPPLPLKAMLVVGKPTIQKIACYHNQNCSVGGREAKIYSHTCGLIIFVKDCSYNTF